MGCSPWGREELDTTERLHFPALLQTKTHSLSGLCEERARLSVSPGLSALFAFQLGRRECEVDIPLKEF